MFQTKAELGRLFVARLVLIQDYELIWCFGFDYFGRKI